MTAAWRSDRDTLADLSTRVGVEPDLLEWAGRQVARPFFHRLGELLAGQPIADVENASVAGCPCCGGAPRFGRYERHEGRRFLWCDLCNIQWSFRRLTCPFCLNKDHEKLGYLSIEGVENYRIDVCEVCRGYLRSLDERGLPGDARVDFVKEDVGTYHLCLAAEKEGWRPGEVTR
jgi:FdhE protein